MMFFRNKFVITVSSIGAFAGGVMLMKDYSGGRTFTDPIRADDKVMIITGANSGIGKEAAWELARRGARVYMACRDMQSCEKAREEIVLDTKNKYVYCRQCDLASQSSIRDFVKSFKQEQSRLDVLINNAGVMRCPRLLTAEGVEMQLGVNHLGHFLLTTLLLDLLKASRPARIVTVSSVAHRRGLLDLADINSEKHYDPGKAYAQSKLANVLFANELAGRLKGTGVTSNSLHPGIVDTAIIRHMSFFTSTFSALFLRPLVWPFVRSPRQGAQTLVYAALSPHLEETTACYFSNCSVADVAPQAKDAEAARWLWALSERWTQPRDSKEKN